MDQDRAELLNATLRTIGIRHRALADAMLAPLGLRTGQEVLLLELALGPRTQSQLVAASGVEPPTITNAVQRLAAAGLIDRRVDPQDARVVVVELSTAGRELIPRLRQAWQELARQTLAGLSRTSPETALDVVSDLADSLSKARATPRPGV